MKDEPVERGEEKDLLKVYIWVMLVMTAGLGVVIWVTRNGLEEKRTAFVRAERALPELAESKAEIEAMLGVFQKNREDEVREQPLTWFSSIWKRLGIPDESMLPGSWQNPPKFIPRGKYYEERFDIKFNQKSPLRREEIAKFLYEIERSSTRQRVIEMTLRRAARDGHEEDQWSGQVVVGYRYPRLNE